jgi:diguanylate cyclase (GGDEF)-like protein
MSLFVLVIVIGALNLALGYALAVRLGFGPEGLRPTWETLSAAGMDGLIDDPWRQQAMPEPAPFAEAPVLAFRSDLVKNEESLIRIDTELRAPRALAGPAVEAHVRGVQTSCETYLADLKKAAEQFRLQTESDAFQPLGEDLDLALVEQSTQVDAVARSLGQLDLAGDPAALTARLIEEVTGLLSRMHQLRDYLDRVCVTIVRQDERLHTIDEGFRRDPMTNLPNRLGLEHLLQEWWQQGRHQSQPLSAVLFDLDGFTKLNQDHGAAAGNHVLHVVAERMRDCLGPNDLIVRYSGQRIAVFLSGVESTDAIEAAERIRQAAQSDDIPCGEMAIPISLSGGIAAILPHDTPQDVLDHLEKTLAEAKQAGRGQLSQYHENERSFEE